MPQKYNVRVKLAFLTYIYTHQILLNKHTSPSTCSGIQRPLQDEMLTF